MSTELVFVRDHTGSMRHIAHLAARDYNSGLASVKSASIAENQPTTASVLTIGSGHTANIGRVALYQDVHSLREIGEHQYEADAPATAWFQSTIEAINVCKNSPNYGNPDHSFLIMITTDGGETVNRSLGSTVARMIRELESEDRWTIVFRVPKGQKNYRSAFGSEKTQLMQLGIPEGNIYEWDQTAKGVAEASQATTEAYTEYFKGRTAGQRRTTRFYANMADVDVEQVKKELVEVTSEVKFFDVTPADHGSKIREFVENTINEPMVRGGAFYQLVKLEPRVQANKRIAIRDKNTGVVYAGDAARQMLALPTVGTVRLAPDELGQWEVFIQSTSVNRVLDKNTKLMYWKGVGKAFQEGPSAN